MAETGLNGKDGHPELLLGVMGDPIAQSKSPLMHGAALKALGLSGAYVPLHITRTSWGCRAGGQDPRLPRGECNHSAQGCGDGLSG